jgi:hypothetical protein
MHNLIENNHLIKGHYYLQWLGNGRGVKLTTNLQLVLRSGIRYTILRKHKNHKLLYKHQIVNYSRYVDDILIVHNTHTTNIKNTLTEFVSMHPQIKFTIEKEIHNKLNYLDLNLLNKHNQLTFGIYWKPISTDLIIHNDSCHPYEHKKSAKNYLNNKMNTYPITYKNKDQEWNPIQEILKKSNNNNH